MSSRDSTVCSSIFLMILPKWVQLAHAGFFLAVDVGAEAVKEGLERADRRNERHLQETLPSNTGL